MEKKTPIRQKDSGMIAGFYIDMECCICGHEKSVTGRSKKDVVDRAADLGWKDLNSDTYGTTGYYCGCDLTPYKD